MWDFEGFYERRLMKIRYKHLLCGLDLFMQGHVHVVN